MELPVNQVTLIAGATANLTDTLKSGELVNHVARQVGGKGGGFVQFGRRSAAGPGVGRAAYLVGLHLLRALRWAVDNGGPGLLGR